MYGLFLIRHPIQLLFLVIRSDYRDHHHHGNAARLLSIRPARREQRWVARRQQGIIRAQRPAHLIRLVLASPDFHINPEHRPQILMDYLLLTKRLLTSHLQLGDMPLDKHTRIAGDLPQFNSLSLMNLVAAIEDELGCSIENEEISVDTFETVDTLARFIESKA